MHRRGAALHGELDAFAGVHRELHLVQVRHLADGGGNDRRRRGAAGARLAEFAFHRAGVAGEGGIEHAVKRDVGSIRYDSQHVGEFDRLFAGGVKRELADFVARGEPVAADQRDERRARVGRDSQIGAAHLVVDQPRQRGVVVDVTRQRGGGFRLFTQRAQRRVLFQIAGFDDDAAIGRRRGQHRLERGGNVAAAGLHQHGAAAAEQRDGVGLLDQPRRIGGELLALDAHEGERVAHVVNRGLHQRVDALAHETCVRPEHQHDRLRRIGAGDKTIGVGGFDGGHSCCRRGRALARAGTHTRRSIDGARRIGPRLRGDDSQTLRPRDEIRCETRADVVGDHLGGAVLGVAQAALAGEALLLTGNVVGHAREGLPGDHRFAAFDVG